MYHRPSAACMQATLKAGDHSSSAKLTLVVDLTAGSSVASGL